jgi:radical SAM protein with 4Fe4S-binding SPASM domain
MIEFFIKDHMPVIAYLEPTLRCNLRCRQCYVEKNIPGKKDELTREEINSVLEGLAGLGTLIIVITGGEPFIRKDILDILSDIRKKGFAVVIFTNATLITRKMAEALYTLAPLGVEISMHGQNVAVQDAITGISGSFDRAISAIELLKKNRVRVKLKGNLMTCNKGDYRSLISLAQSLDVEYTFDPYIYPKRDLDRNPAQFRQDNGGLEKILGDPCLYPQRVDENKKTYLEFPENRVCGAGRNIVNISSNGDVFPCVPLKLNLGNVRENPIEKIWAHNPLLKCFRQYKNKDLKYCMDCQHKRFCAYCMAMAYNETGDLLGCSPGLQQLALVRERIHQDIKVGV